MSTSIVTLSGASGVRVLLVCVALIVAAGGVCAQPRNISGVVNIATPVLGIDHCANRITVASIEGFMSGDRVVIVQMKGAEIDTSSTPGFGRVTRLNNAGRYEMATIETLGGRTVVLRNNLLNRYDIGGAVQMVRVPVYENVHVVAPLTAQPWNGAIGGVLAIEVTGVLRLEADIDVSGRGFRGGGVAPGTQACSFDAYFTDPSSGRGGRKGEGIADIDAVRSAGRGPLANGAGGGNDHNSGGAGGGNVGAGGAGGYQWEGCEPFTNGGIGGAALPTDESRIFLGGGGGAGHQNFESGTGGRDGGGIVIVRADRIEANGHAIRADGIDHTASSGPDGAGGGGAGGVVVIDADEVVGDLTLSAAGGAGGNYDGDCLCHGPGGGGGGGLIAIGSGTPIGSLATSVAGGAAGLVVVECAPCHGTSYGAAAGEPGLVMTEARVPEGSVRFEVPSSTLSLPMIEVDPGDTLVVSFLITQRNLSLPSADSFTARLRWNRRMLRPLDAASTGLEQGEDRIFDIAGRINDTTTVLARFRFLALLADVDSTRLHIESFAWDTTDCPVRMTLDDGEVVLSTCRVGGPRLIAIGPETALRSCTPNPASASAEISYTLAVDGRARLYLSDLNGQRVALLLDEEKRVGDHSVRLATAELAPGLYFYTLETETETITRTLEIVR